jgi:hypothetical protein
MEKAPQPVPFGPPADSIQAYRALMDTLAEPNGVDQLPRKYDPRMVAEGFAMRVDSTDGGNYDTRSIGKFVAPDGLEKDDYATLHHLLYVAGAFGFQIGKRTHDTNANIAGFSVSFPEKDKLPPLPQKNARGDICDERGRPLPDIHVDALYLAHYLADFPDIIKRPRTHVENVSGEEYPQPHDYLGNRVAESRDGAMETLFRKVVEQAESPEHVLRVTDKRSDPRRPLTPEQQKGNLSLIRQAARVMGYEVGPFVPNGHGQFEMKVGRPMPGFDTKRTLFKELKDDHWDDQVETRFYVAAPVINLGRWVTAAAIPQENPVEELKIAA